MKYFVKYCAKPENIYYRALRQVFRELSRFFASVCTCSLTLNSSGTTFHGLLHVMSQLIKQLLTWYLTHDKVYEVVQALICFNKQGTLLGSKATCYLSHPNSAGQADNVIFKLYGLEPGRIYKNITHKQSQTGVSASLKRRSEDLKFIARRTQRKC